MRRAVAALFATFAGLALLLSYTTSPGTATRPLATASTPTTTAPVRQGTVPAAAGPPPTTAVPSPLSTPARPTPPTSAPAPSASRASGTFTGPVVETRYGPVQVQVTLADGGSPTSRPMSSPSTARGRPP